MWSQLTTSDEPLLASVIEKCSISHTIRPSNRQTPRREDALEQPALITMVRGRSNRHSKIHRHGFNGEYVS